LTLDNLPPKLKILYYIEDCGLREGGAASQITLVWLQAQKPWIVPIPGTSVSVHLREIIGANEISFSTEELQEFNKGLSEIDIAGAKNVQGVIDAMGVEAPPKR